MAITRWSPFQELDSLERRMRRTLEGAGFAPALLPAADVYETEDEVVVELEVPGFAEQELTVEVADHTLVVKGEQAETTDEKRKTYRLHERLERTFERRFLLPPEADTRKLSAEFAQGVLAVRAKKIGGVTPTTVPIELRE